MKLSGTEFPHNTLLAPLPHCLILFSTCFSTFPSLLRYIFSHSFQFISPLTISLVTNIFFNIYHFLFPSFFHLSPILLPPSISYHFPFFLHSPQFPSFLHLIPYFPTILHLSPNSFPIIPLSMIPLTITNNKSI